MENQNETVITEQIGSKQLVVKKYANRKFYNTEASQYMTLGEIQGAVKSGRTVSVIDNVSKRDITAKTLLMSLIETESAREDLSTADVIALIKNGISAK